MDWKWPRRNCKCWGVAKWRRRPSLRQTGIIIIICLKPSYFLCSTPINGLSSWQLLSSYKMKDAIAMLTLTSKRLVFCLRAIWRALRCVFNLVMMTMIKMIKMMMVMIKMGMGMILIFWYSSRVIWLKMNSGHNFYGCFLKCWIF